MKYIALILFSVIFSTSVFSQGKDRRERIKTLKIAFITEKLELTKDEAQGFWPVYNAHETSHEQLRKASRQNRRDANLETMTEDDAKTMIKKMLALEEEKLELRTQFTNDLLNVIPAKKVILLKIAEDEFNKRILNEIRKRKGNKKE